MNLKEKDSCWDVDLMTTDTAAVLKTNLYI